MSDHRYFYMSNGAAQGPVVAGILASLNANGNIDDGMVCPEGSSAWVKYGVLFPAGKAPDKAEAPFIQKLRSKSHYQVARSMIRWTAGFAILALVIGAATFIFTGPYDTLKAYVAALALLQIGGIIGLAQFAQAMLDGADAVVSIAQSNESI